jgi:hypothetical protein
VDPFKAAEPSKPRGSTSSKRPPRLSDEIHASAKNSEADVAEDDAGLVGQAQSAIAEAVSDTAALEEDDFNALIDPSLRPAIQQLQAATHAMTQSAHEMKEAAGPDPEIDNPRTEDPAETETPVQAKLTIHIDPQLSNSSSTGIKAESHPHHHHHYPAALATSSSQISANSLVSPPDSHHNDDFSPSDHNPDPDLKHNSVGTNAEGGSGGGSSSDSTTSSLFNNNALQTPKSAASRHSSRQPKPVERYVPDAGVRSGNGREGNKKEGDEIKQLSSTASGQMIKEEARRASSSGDSVATSSNLNTEGGGSKARGRMSSHTSPCAPPSASARAEQNVTSPQSPSQARVKHGLPGDATATESETQLKAEEESLKLIRALQEEEFGLRRRRGSMRA